MPSGFSLRRFSVQRLKRPSNANLAEETLSRKNSSANLLHDALHSPQVVQIGTQAESPISNVWNLLHSSLERPIAPMLYCEMLYLQMGQGQSDMLGEAELAPSWKQTHRWIRYEEAVEGEGTRFSKPYVSFVNLQALLQLRNSLKRGVVMLDQEYSTLPGLLNHIQQTWIERGLMTEDRASFVKMVLNAPKFHLIHGRLRRADELLAPEKQLQLHRKLQESNDSTRSEQNSSEESLSTTKIEDPDEHLIKKLATGTEAAAILVADLPGIQHPLSAFVRLRNEQLYYPDLPDHSIPVRFVFVLLNSSDALCADETFTLGRTMGALLCDEVFQTIAYKCNEKFTLADAVDEFISQSILIPPTKASLSSRCRAEDLMVENPKEITKKRIGLVSDETKHSGHTNEISVSGRFFGGLCNDIKRKLPHYASDFTDFFRGSLTKTIGSVILMFFANLTNILAFGALMHKLFNGEISAIENIVCAALSGIVFGLFSGQPLNILSATGPTLIFEKIIYDICVQQGWSFLAFRFYMGLFICLFLLVIVAKDLSALVGFITRFTEEAFAVLVSVVFVIQAVQTIWEIRLHAPLTLEPEKILANPVCRCSVNGSRISMESAEGCLDLSGTLSGDACFFRPDVFLFSVMLAFGTFGLAMYLRGFKYSPYLTSKIRNCVSDFGVLISIVVFTTLSHIVGIRIDHLQVPDHLVPTMKRSWIVDITDISPYSALISGVPALLYTILIVMDQQITAVIVNRKDNKLKKGDGYHLDLLIVALLVLICSFFGLPFYVAATVLSIAHLDSLKIQSDVSAPGEVPTFYGINEQRLTVIISHVMIGLSLFLTRFVRLVPTTVLIGIFLYMGVVSLGGQQFIQRLMLFLMPVKYQPDYKWLRSVQMKRVHLFTFIQLLSILALFGLKSLDGFKILFPVLLVLMVIIRAFLLERIFTQTELMALDDRLLGWREVMRPKKSAQKQTKLTSKDIEADKLSETTPFESNNNDS